MKKKQPDGGFLKHLCKKIQIMRVNLFLLAISSSLVLSANTYSHDVSGEQPPTLPRALKSVIEQPQQKGIRGSVTDSDGLPLPGVTVIVKGTTIGAISNVDGEFSFSIPGDADTLQFSFVGMKTKMVPVEGKTTFSVVMEAAVTELEEIVAVGYGVQKKESVVGAISHATQETLERRGGVTNLAQALSGQLPGVSVLEFSGEPGKEDPIIYIRGLSSWNEGQPLLLVDGIERRINDLDVSEVESVSVLKDASATAVFGVKGANGVILITTKRGKVGKAKLSMSANYGIKNISKVYNVMDSYDQYGWMNHAIESGGFLQEAAWGYYTPEPERQYYKKPQEDPYTYLFPNINWADVLLQNFAHNHRFNLNISGGTDFVKYFGSVAYSHEGDIFKSPYNEEQGYDPSFAYNRLNFRGNLDFKLTESTNLSVNVSGYTGAKHETRLFGVQQVFDGVYFQDPSFMVPEYEDGIPGFNPREPNKNNPIAVLNKSGVARTNRNELNTDVRLNQGLDFIIEGLSAEARFSFDNRFITGGPNINDGGNWGQGLLKYIDPSILYALTPEDSLSAVQYQTIGGYSGAVNEFDYQNTPVSYGAENVNNGNLLRVLYYQFSLNYNRQFEKNTVSALALVSRRENATGAMFPQYREDWVGRVTYNYDSRYFLEVNGAYNGSEKFSSEYRFGFFPSLALGWTLSNESFLSFEWLSELKLRGSIGKVGSDAGIPRWGYLDSWRAGNTSNFGSGLPFRFNYTWTNTGYRPYYEDVIANPDLSWETAVKKNIGCQKQMLSHLHNSQEKY
jgi:TonB-linked SusC/RagA family outer membrane protein